MYKIVDNANNIHEMNFKSDKECLKYMEKRYIDFIAKIVTDNRISIYKPDGYLLADIKTATGEQIIHNWN